MPTQPRTQISERAGRARQRINEREAIKLAYAAELGDALGDQFAPDFDGGWHTETFTAGSSAYINCTVLVVSEFPRQVVVNAYGAPGAVEWSAIFDRNVPVAAIAAVAHAAAGLVAA